MARCYLTSVEFRVEDGHVLNRVGAHRLLRTLKNRAESLERLIAQLSPLDNSSSGLSRAGPAGGKQLRMICKALAEALAHAYPEIELFLSWPALISRNTRDRMQLLKQHPLYGGPVSALTDDELVQAARLSKQVLRLIDPRRELSHSARVALKAGICIQHRGQGAKEISELIRSAVSRNGDLTALGVAEEEAETALESLKRILPREATEHAKP